jgi:delta-aminolevulinic acid dehydratase/porphobilinogen synthase
MEIEGQLHASAGAGISILSGSQDVDDLVASLRHSLDATALARVQIKRAGNGVQQGVLPIQ